MITHLSTMVYYNDAVTQQHVERCPANINRCNTIESFRNSTHLRKIAVFNIPFPYETSVRESFESKIDQVLDVCDYILIMSSELHQETVNFMNRYNYPKIKYFVCGFLEKIEHKPWLDWFITSTEFYKITDNNPLNKLTPYVVKPKVFDILLGTLKPHRSAIYSYIKTNNLQEKVIMTTYSNDSKKILSENNNSAWVWDNNGIEIIDANITYSGNRIRYYGYEMCLSQVVPIDIYNQTAYSIVAETNFDNNYSFYTEKIVKPILGRRLFLVVSGQHYLRNLRSLGFKTFDGIVDETYDTIEDFNQRAKLICEQIDYLMRQDQQTVLEKIKPITDYNYKLMMETDWLSYFYSEFYSQILGINHQSF